MRSIYSDVYKVGERKKKMEVGERKELYLLSWNL